MNLASLANAELAVMALLWQRRTVSNAAVGPA